MNRRAGLSLEAADADEIDRLIARLGDSPVALAEFARTFLLRRGHGLRARALCDRAAGLAPDNREVRAICAEVRAAGVGTWLFAMVRDEIRQGAYQRAIAAAVCGGARVLDIGTGTGLFAMMAARAGASEVLSCERNEAVAEAARAAVARNGLADRVTILAKSSTEIMLGEDLAQPADVLIWDNTGSDLVGLGTLPALEDALRRLVKPSGQVIPAGVSIQAALADYDRLAGWRMGSAAGFDLTPFNALAQPVIPLDHGDPHLAIRSEAVTLFRFAFVPGARFAPERVIRQVTAAGGGNGLVQWLEFDIDAHETYSGGPDAAYSAFTLNFRPTPEPFETKAERLFAIGAAHDRENLRLWLEERR